MKKFVLTLTVAFLALGACSSKDSLEKRGPDEYMVLTNPPLVLPPDFTLRAPVKTEEPAVSAAQDELDGIVRQCAAFAPNCATPADSREAIGAALHARSRLATEQRALETMQQQIRSMRVILGDEETAEDAEALELDGAKISYDLRQARQRLSDLTTRLAAKHGAIGATGSAVELEAEAELLAEHPSWLGI